MSAAQLIRDALKRCQADPAQIIHVNTLEHLEMIEDDGLHEYMVRDPNPNIAITSKIVWMEPFRERLILERTFDVIIGIEALTTDTEGLALEIGRQEIPFEGAHAQVVIPLVSLAFSTVKICSRARFAVRTPFRIIGCFLGHEYRVELAKARTILCEREFSQEALEVHFGCARLETDRRSDSRILRLPCPSKFMDEDPTINWADSNLSKYPFLPYSPYLRTKAKLMSSKLANSVRPRRIMMKRIAAWFNRL